MKIYTKTGDTGGTALFGGERVPKHHDRVDTYGTIDEANSTIGFAAAAPDLPSDVKQQLLLVMSDLFDVGAELATPPRPEMGEKLAARLSSRVDEVRIQELEREIDRMESVLPPLTTFILPTGAESSARLQMARTVTRRAERRVSELAMALSTELHALHDDKNDKPALRPAILAYLNRLSDYLFVASRYANHKNGVADVPWLARKETSL